QPDSALTYDRAGLTLKRVVSDRAGEAGALNNIGTVYQRIGRLDSALVYFRAAVPLNHAAGDRRAEAANLTNIASVYAVTARPDSALAVLDSAIVVFATVRMHV